MANDRRVAMGAPIPLRDDYDAAILRRLAKNAGDANQTRWLLALASIHDSGSRGAAASLQDLHAVPPAAFRLLIMELHFLRAKSVKKSFSGGVWYFSRPS